MDDSDIVILDLPTRRSPEIARSTNEDYASFSANTLIRRSFSQPILPPSAPKDDVVNHSYQTKALISPLKAKTSKTSKILQDEFFGVYCLVSRSSIKHYKNRCYIGYTVDPNRRIRQHNGGREKGGAKKTDNRGPWDMVCIIHGFPNSIAALRFEWAWQNPDKSRVIKGLVLKKSRKETPFAYRLRIACHLMNARPWNSFALTFRWLLPLEEQPFPEEIRPPLHVCKEYGLIQKSTCEVPLTRDGYVEKGDCRICGEEIHKLNQFVRCPYSLCAAHYHARCLALNGLKGDRQLLYPVEGNCPRCSRSYLWGDIIRDQRMIIRVDESQTNDFLKGLVPRPFK